MQTLAGSTSTVGNFSFAGRELDVELEDVADFGLSRSPGAEGHCTALHPPWLKRIPPFPALQQHAGGVASALPHSRGLEFPFCYHSASAQGQWPLAAPSKVSWHLES